MLHTWLPIDIRLERVLDSVALGKMTGLIDKLVLGLVDFACCLGIVHGIIDACGRVVIELVKALIFRVLIRVGNFFGVV